MKEYKIAFIQRKLGKWFLAVKENETSETRWLSVEFKTKKEALSRFKTMYAPIGTKEVVKTKSLELYEVYEAR